jgi:2-dehydropantoate 2-reductase
VQKINIGIIGLGGIGGLIAILLKNRNYNVFSNKKIKKKNIKLFLKSNYYGNLTAKIKIDPSLKKTNVIFICSKYPFLNKHLKPIRNNKALVIPFLNGLSHFDILKKKFGKKCFVSNVGKVVSKKNKVSEVLHASNNAPEVLISFKNKKKREKNIIKKIFRDINFKTKIKTKDSVVIWTKLVRLSAISAITSLYNCNLGQISKSKLKMHQLNTLIKEALFISKKIYNFKEKYTNIQKLIKSFPKNLTTSLQRDINSNLNSELETQIGAIVKLSEDYNISAPMYKKIYLKLKKKCQKKS